MGFVFNFITYGGHQIDGVAAEEFATALRQDGMLALARLQRKMRLVESPYRTPQTLVGGPRSDAALAASSGRTATTKAMGKGSTQHQHLVQTEVPRKLLEEWLAMWAGHYQIKDKLRVQLRPQRAGSEVLELGIYGAGEEKLANVIFQPIQDRRGRTILLVRDQNTFSEELRQKRLMTLIHLWLVHRFKADGGALRHPHRRQPLSDLEDEVPWHLQRGQPGGGRDHRRRGEPPPHRGAVEARPRSAAEVDHEGSLERFAGRPAHRTVAAAASAIASTTRARVSRAANSWLRVGPCATCGRRNRLGMRRPRGARTRQSTMAHHAPQMGHRHFRRLQFPAAIPRLRGRMPGYGQTDCMQVVRVENGDSDEIWS